MTGDRWTLLLLKGHDSPPRQYTVSPRVVRWALLGTGAFALLLVGLFAWLGHGGIERLEASRLEQENRILAGELATLRERVAGLEGSLDDLSNRDARLRLLAGLDAIDDDVLQVGVGGPGLGTPESNPLWAVDSTLSKTAFAVEYDVNALERRARLLSASMSEATDSLVAHRDLLESTPSILPAPGLLSSRFSKSRWHPIHHRPLPHEGVDISAPQGTPILAAAKGTVVRAGWVSGYGNMVEIDHGYGYVTRYGHASKILVRVGQTVERGEAIAQVGRSGIATSSHLHYEVRVDGRPRNPLNFVISGAVP